MASESLPAELPAAAMSAASSALSSAPARKPKATPTLAPPTRPKRTAAAAHAPTGPTTAKATAAATAATPTATAPPTAAKPAKSRPTRRAESLDQKREGLIAILRRHYPNADLSRVERAFDFAVEAHAGQTRASGEPFVTHPIEAALILADLGIAPIAVEGELLRGVPEDTEYSLVDIEERFGPEVARLVDGVTKLSKFSTHSHEQQQAENIRKMLLAMADDIRV